ncbi:MAG: ATP-binding protein [Roseibacillus sp.]
MAACTLLGYWNRALFMLHRGRSNEAIHRASSCSARPLRAFTSRLPPKRTQPVERRDAPAISAARNPCPGAYYGNPKRDCRCALRQIEIYRQRIPGPLLDRIELHVEVPLVAGLSIDT